MRAISSPPLPSHLSSLKPPAEILRPHRADGVTLTIPLREVIKQITRARPHARRAAPMEREPHTLRRLVPCGRRRRRDILRRTRRAVREAIVKPAGHAHGGVGTRGVFPAAEVVLYAVGVGDVLGVVVGTGVVPGAGGEVLGTAVPAEEGFGAAVDAVVEGGGDGDGGATGGGEEGELGGGVEGVAGCEDVGAYVAC